MPTRHSYRSLRSSPSSRYPTVQPICLPVSFVSSLLAGCLLSLSMSMSLIASVSVCV